MKRLSRISLLVVAGVVAILAVAGCSRSLLTSPELETSATSTSAPVTEQETAPAPPAGRLAGPSFLGIELPPIMPLLQSAWRTLTSTLVRVGDEKTVAAGRYELDFQKGSLSKDALVTITDYDSDILDVELGPSGTQFDEPVLLSIDFVGTAADPGAATYDPNREPAIYWLNEKTNQWEEVPSTTDWSRHRIEARLKHFSRYLVGGKAGWKGQPSREDD